MRAALVFLVLWLFSVATPAHGIVNGAPSPRTPAFVPNEVIVKYKTGQSPQELQAIVAKRAMERKTVLGFIKLFFADLKQSTSKQETPETKLQRLGKTDKKAEVVSKESVFKGVADPTLKNTYLLELKQGSDVLKVVKLYETLPEIEYAEPNYTVTIRKSR